MLRAAHRRGPCPAGLTVWAKGGNLGPQLRASETHMESSKFTSYPSAEGAHLEEPRLLKQRQRNLIDPARCREPKKPEMRLGRYR